MSETFWGKRYFLSSYKRWKAETSCQDSHHQGAQITIKHRLRSYCFLAGFRPFLYFPHFPPYLVYGPIFKIFMFITYYYELKLDKNFIITLYFEVDDNKESPQRYGYVVIDS